MAATWLDPDPAGQLVEARLVLHHVVQVVAAVGQSLAPRAPDDSQQSLVVDPAGRWLGVPVAGGRLRAGLDPVRLELSLCDGAGEPLARLPMAGLSLQSGLAFLAGELERRGIPTDGLSLPRHPPDFPRHALANGALVPPDRIAERVALCRMFSGSEAILARLGVCKAPRLWPHHFDLGCSLTVGSATVALGFSPGDGTWGRPYWYVTPWPFPPRATLAPLAGGGIWHTEVWQGAELPLDRLDRRVPSWRPQVAAFLRSALGAVEASVTAGPRAGAIGGAQASLA